VDAVDSALRTDPIEADGDRAQSVLSVDDGMDQLHKTAYRSLSRLIERQSELIPQALTTLMIARNLWRVAGHAKSIAEDVIFWVRGSDVRHMFSLAEAD